MLTVDDTIGTVGIPGGAGHGRPERSPGRTHVLCAVARADVGSSFSVGRRPRHAPTRNGPAGRSRSTLGTAGPRCDVHMHDHEHADAADADVVCARAKRCAGIVDGIYKCTSGSIVSCHEHCVIVLPLSLAPMFIFDSPAASVAPVGSLPSHKVPHLEHARIASAPDCKYAVLLQASP